MTGWRELWFDTFHRWRWQRGVGRAWSGWHRWQRRKREEKAWARYEERKALVDALNEMWEKLKTVQPGTRFPSV